MTRRARPPAGVSSVLDDVLGGLGIKERLEQSRTAARWSEVTGPRIAAKTRVRGIRRDGLVVEVKNAAWLTQLGMMKRDLLERLNEGRQCGQIGRLVFVQGSGDWNAPGRNGRGT
ncbi:MAG: DUF721 domain-containing protein [Gemmatimonadetes bacterium]|nr:DUF721 domain-containing protein [Gemmatimonadota bacterium]